MTRMSGVISFFLFKKFFCILYVSMFLCLVHSCSINEKEIFFFSFKVLEGGLRESYADVIMCDLYVIISGLC